MEKKGQFFIMAALVIVGIIITLAAVNISVRTPPTETTSFYDLSKEIDFEANKLIDYGVYRQQDVGPLITSLISNYSATNPDTELLFVYGNPCDLTVKFYDRVSTGSEGISTGGIEARIEQHQIKASTPQFTCEGNDVNVQLSAESSLDFELRSGENFFIFLKKEVGEETFVAKKE